MAETSRYSALDSPIMLELVEDASNMVDVEDPVFLHVVLEPDQHGSQLQADGVWLRNIGIFVNTLKGYGDIILILRRSPL